jgi:pyruvate carboxylase
LDSKKKPFKSVLAANRGEIAARILRGAEELGMKTVAVYAYEDRYSSHRWGADQSYELPARATPTGAYLDAQSYVEAAKKSGAEAIHPGYGFLSESPGLAQACADNGITFVGPSVSNLNDFSDKTSARNMAIKAGVPVIPGTDGPIDTAEDAVKFCETSGFPVMIKASMGGGGKGMRIAYTKETVADLFNSASSEALASFGSGECFIERYLPKTRHIEVQIFGDGTGGKGSVVHLWERDCSVQRRHQKVLEIAPGWDVPPKARAAILADAVKLGESAGYKNAGTVEFLLDVDTDEHFFIEVNPRVQVEHTVTEEVTGVDIIQTQMLIAGGATLKDLGFVDAEGNSLVPPPKGVALQARITTEDPAKGFQPDTGTLMVYRPAFGYGVRVDGTAYSGMTVTPFFDSLLVKYSVRAENWDLCVRRMRRALLEMRIRGVKTNIPFILNVLEDPRFTRGAGGPDAIKDNSGDIPPVTTRFIDESPELLQFVDHPCDGDEECNVAAFWKMDTPAMKEHQESQSRTFELERNLRYLANLAVNGHPTSLGADKTKLHLVRKTELPDIPEIAPPSKPLGFRKMLRTQGPAAVAKAVRSSSNLLLTDTTWRDAHQSLLATRVRTVDLARAAEASANALGGGVFSMEMWGGATFDVAMRFLHECPWKRLRDLRALTGGDEGNAPLFQMLFRGANAVGYSAYPANLIDEFAQRAFDSGMDVFRVFDSLNDVDNMRVGIKAAAKTGAIVEAAIAYTGDVTKDDPKYKYALSYYLDMADKLVGSGVKSDVAPAAHMLAIKDMAGLLTPAAATKLVSALREKFPEVPIHVHTHDTAGLGTASMLAAAQAGADVVDVSTDAMSGLTAQPSLGAFVNAWQGGAGKGPVALERSKLAPIDAYWDGVRTQLYAPFESGQLSTASDVVEHEIPGGQYTNLLFQSKQLGLDGQFGQVKSAYAQANLILGDIPKVTPSSKVVGDLAQFMVANKFTKADEVREKAAELSFPDSVVGYLQGNLGTPPGGWESDPKLMAFRLAVLGARKLEPMSTDTTAAYSMPPYDFEKAKDELTEAYGARMTPDDVLSNAMYPAVFQEWQTFKEVYGSMETMPTHAFLRPLEVGQEVEFETEVGRKQYVKLAAISPLGDGGPATSRMVTFEVNGERWFIRVSDDVALKSAQESGGAREKKTAAMGPGAIGAPMPGAVVKVGVKEGDEVKKGETLFTLSAMKMETAITATMDGTVEKITVTPGDTVEGDDLLAMITE